MGSFAQLRFKVPQDLAQIGRITYDQDVLERVTVHYYVVQNAAICPATTGVDRAPVGDPQQIIGNQAIDGVEGPGARYFEAPHVRHIEEAGLKPYAVMLRDDTRILNGHLPTRVGD